jgi:hypothetical protein
MKLKSVFIKVILIFISISIIFIFIINSFLYKHYRTDYTKKYKNFLNYSLGNNWKVVSKKEGSSSLIGTDYFYIWNIEYKDKDNITRNFEMDNYSSDSEDSHIFGFYVNNNLNKLISKKFTDEIISKYIPVNFNKEDQKTIWAYSYVEDGDTTFTSKDYQDVFYKKISDPKTGIRFYDFNFKNTFVNNSRFLNITIYIDKSVNSLEVEKSKTSISKMINDLNSYTNNTVNCVIELDYDNKDVYSVALLNGKDVTKNINQDPKVTFWGNYVKYIKNYYNIEN